MNGMFVSLYPLPTRGGEMVSPLTLDRSDVNGSY
jgi:hypothetical protein